MRSTFRSSTWPRYCTDIGQGFLCRVRRWSPQRHDDTSPSSFLDLCAVPLRQRRHCSDKPDVSFPSPYVYWTVSVGLFFVPVDIVRLDQEIDSWTPCLFCLHLHHDIDFCKRHALWVVDYRVVLERHWQVGSFEFPSTKTTYRVQSSNRVLRPYPWSEPLIWLAGIWEPLALPGQQSYCHRPTGMPWTFLYGVDISSYFFHIS